MRRPLLSTLFPYTTLFRSGLIAISGSLPGFWRWTIGTLVGYASTNWTPSLVWMRARDSILPFLVDRKSTRLNSSHLGISYAVFCLKKKKNQYVWDSAH